MKTTIIIKSAVLAVLILILSGCVRQAEPEAVYLEYMKAAKNGYASAQQKYCHFESDDTKEVMGLTSSKVLKYEIIELDEITDSLWVVTAKTLTSTHPEVWYVFTNYIGVVDGEYKVLLNSNEVPEQLKQGIDLERYDIFLTQPAE